MVCFVLFDGCFLTLSPARRGDGIMCSGAELSGEKSRAAVLMAPPLPPPQTPHCEKSLDRALGAWRIHRLAKCRARLKGTVSLGRLILSSLSEALSHNVSRKYKKQPYYTHVTKSWCLQSCDAVCCCLLVLMVPLTPSHGGVT